MTRKGHEKCQDCMQPKTGVSEQACRPWQTCLSSAASLAWPPDSPAE